jgi:NADPH:quinone reductase-like Zn-dependent oxidoreductase
VLDTIGGAVHRRSAEVLAPGGRLVYLSAVPIEPTSRTDIRVEQARAVASRERLAQLLQWAAERKIKPQIGRRFSLAQLPEAYAASQTMRARGKIIITF